MYNNYLSDKSLKGDRNMYNEKLIKEIHEEKEQFYILRNKIVKESCQEVKEKNYQVRSQALEELKWSGFDVQNIGTQYLATLITIFFHERKLYSMSDKSFYWNLADRQNEHYKMLGTKPKQVIKSINEVVKENIDEEGPVEDIVYELADNIAWNHNHEEQHKPYLKRY